MEVFFVMTQGRTSCCQVLLIVSLGKGATHWRDTETLEETAVPTAHQSTENGGVADV